MNQRPIVVLLRFRTRREERQVVYEFFQDLIRTRIRVVIPSFPELWRLFGRRYGRSLRDLKLERWVDRLIDRRWVLWNHLKWRSKLISFVRNFSETNQPSAPVILLPISDDASLDEQLFHHLADDGNLCVVNLGKTERDRYLINRIDRSISFNYPDERSALLLFLMETTHDRRIFQFDQRNFGVSSDLEDFMSEIDLSHEFDEDIRIGSSERTITEQFDEVRLGASAPRAVSSSENFVARFAAYTKETRPEISRILKLEAPSTELRLDLHKCRWHQGARVTVRLGSTAANVLNPVQSFEWDGKSHILRFDLQVHDDATAKYLVLRFDVAVEGLPITSLRPEILIHPQEDLDRADQAVFIERVAPRSAFASYALEDQREVMGRVRSVQISTGIDVFLDCLSLRPGDQWKPKLKSEIIRRDIFWLFWSRNAMKSEWVEWEWRTALAQKALLGIQPHPLEPSSLAPPPEELSSLQFGVLYEWYLSQLRQLQMSSPQHALSHSISVSRHHLLKLFRSDTLVSSRILALALVLILLGTIWFAVVWIMR